MSKKYDQFSLEDFCKIIIEKTNDGTLIWKKKFAFFADYNKFVSKYKDIEFQIKPSTDLFGKTNHISVVVKSENLTQDFKIVTKFEGIIVEMFKTVQRGPALKVMEKLKTI